MIIRNDDVLLIQDEYQQVLEFSEEGGALNLFFDGKFITVSPEDTAVLIERLKEWE